MQEALEIRVSIAELTDKRFDDGDISELKTIAARVDKLNTTATSTVQQQNVAIAEVRTATRQLQQASDNLAILEQQVAPALVEALEIAKMGFANGGTEYLLVLQTTTRCLDNKARSLDQKAAYGRALVELERAVGCHLRGWRSRRCRANRSDIH